MIWAGCFERTPDDVTVDEIRTALSEHRADTSPTTDTETNGSDETVSKPP